MDNNLNENLENQSSAPVAPALATTNINQISYKKWVLGVFVAFIVIGGAFRLGYISGEKGYTFNGKDFTITNKQDAPANVDYGLLWQAIKIVQDKYIDSSSIDPQKVLYGAIRGAVAAAGDQYTQFFDPKTLSDFKTELQGSFSGIGAEVGIKNGSIVIVAPLEDSPAAKAGVRAQDIIVKVNGESTDTMTVDEVVGKIRGDKGTQVVLTLFREGGTSTFDVTITRDTIEIKSVKLEYKTINGKSIAVITVSRFGDDTKQLFDAAVTDITKNNPAGVIVDLRNDPGGYLNTAVDLASDWLETGKLVVSEAHSDSDVIKYNSSGTDRLGKFKTVVLINGGSASAAEILSGALHDNGKAMLIGEKSFGKGSVQELVPLGKDAAVKVTIAKWITPNGKNLNKDGLDPDIKVELTPDDVTAGRDPQLDRALQEVVK